MYADNAVGAFCATGNGEAITKTVLCHTSHQMLMRGEI